MTQLIPLLKSILSLPFGTAFKNMPTTKTGITKKESFLLIMAICLTEAARRFNTVEVVQNIKDLRHHFFFVEAHGDLMESWLKNFHSVKSSSGFGETNRHYKQETFLLGDAGFRRRHILKSGSERKGEDRFQQRDELRHGIRRPILLLHEF